MAPEPPRRSSGAAATGHVLRYPAALALFGVGATHLQQYFAVYYRVIPVIGDLFAATFAVAVVLGLALLVPLERIGRFGRPLLALVALGGIGFAAGTIIGLGLSEAGTLFGFHEHGYRLAIILSIALEAVTVILLAAFLAVQVKAGTLRPSTGTPPPPGPTQPGSDIT